MHPAVLRHDIDVPADGRWDEDTARRWAVTSDRLAALHLVADEHQRDVKWSADRERELAEVVDERVAIVARYVAGLDVRTVGRCPFTGLVLTATVDGHSLAGPWWWHHHPQGRAVVGPATHVATSGSLALAGPPEHTVELVAPGPGVPAVVPRLLADSDVMAVMASFPVGEHRAVVTTYWSPTATAPPDPPNDWPWDHRIALDGWSSRPQRETVDVDLVPWLEAGRLSWIEPDDESATLHGGTDGCPYLGWPGTADEQRIQMGVTW